MSNSFDYIIVGAGSAGCVLANKLSADGQHTVLLLEAGPMDRSLMIHMPAGVYHAYRDPKINWNYNSEPESSLLNRQIETPRGKVVGGSSSINSMVYMRGHPLDYDRWADEQGLQGWRYADCLPYFKAGESSDRGADEWRGGDGPLGVTKGAYQNPLYDAFIEAGGQAGQGRSDDLNGYKPEGIARFDTTTRHGRRCSAAVAHLRPALPRANLTLIVKALVQKLMFSGNRVIGLTYKHGATIKTVEATREVILCGGAINSPQTLMLSGIGPADHLRSHDIDPVCDLPGVGRNLQDHATVIMQWACTKPVSIDKMTNPLRQGLAGARWLMTRSGIVASSVWEAGGLIRGNDRVSYPNLQYHMAPVGVSEESGTLKLLQAFAIHIDQLRPRSRGRVDLRSKDPSAKPALHFNYLSDPHDMGELVEGVRKARELVAQPAFDEFRGKELSIGGDAQSDADITAGIRAHTNTDYHPCGTCRMGTGPDAVVDEEMRVHGIDGLRVVDASVMPQIISANLNAPTQMIAARAADFILGKQPLAPFHARFHFKSDLDHDKP